MAHEEIALILSNIHSPEDLKKVPKKQIPQLAREIRKTIINVVNKNGGHMASNLGAVELTLALHRAFDSPKDAIVWDVGHQCYTHKILTGRYEKFQTIRKRGGLSGFPKQSESEHDFFDTGHASTSISSALGLLMARDISGDGGKVVAVIGDGALTGGMAFEALSHAGQLSKNLIVVLNDNQMSIDHNTGSVSRYLSRLTMTAPYQTFRHKIDRFVDRIPYFNRHIEKFIFRFKRAIKGLLLTNNLFVDLGFEYVGPLNGHDEQTLEAIFQRVKKLPRPVVVHVVTKKGKGYKPAEDEPEHYHGVSPQSQKSPTFTKEVDDAEDLCNGGESQTQKSLMFTKAFGDALVSVAEKRHDIVAVTAAMAQGTGLVPFEEKFARRFFDVGIAEEHAVTFAAGLAKGGLLPVVCIYSTFIQRAIDQIIEDIALQNARAVIVLDRAGAVPDDGETHQGIFDIALLRPIPNLAILCPASAEDLRLCLEWAVSEAKSPVAIRYPKASCPTEYGEFSERVISGRGVLVTAEKFAPSLAVAFEEMSAVADAPALADASAVAATSAPAESSAPAHASKKILLVCTGGMYAETLVAARSLLLEGVYADIYALRFIKPLDEDYFVSIAKKYDGVLIIEDGVVAGGVSEYLSCLLMKRGFANVATKAFAEKFYVHGTRQEILADAKMSPSDLADVAKIINS